MYFLQEIHNLSPYSYCSLDGVPEVDAIVNYFERQTYSSPFSGSPLVSVSLFAGDGSTAKRIFR